jgi:Transcriptional regulator, AbiEi antitoxin
MEIDLEVRARARRGWFSRADAISCGYEDSDLAAAVKRGELVRLRQGAYAFRTTYEACDARQQHLLKARAVLARQDGAAALAGVTAAAAHGLVLHDVDLSAVHLVRLDRGASRREAGVVHHRVTGGIAEDVVSCQGLPVVSVGRSVWELASTASLVAGVCAADSALRLYPGVAQDLRALKAAFAQRPGSRRARIALRLADPRAQSAGESTSRVVFFRHAFPKPELQYEVLDDDDQTLAYCDFWWPGFRHVGEFDGRIKYGRLVPDGQSSEDVVFAEKRREDLVRSRVLGMSRWIWFDITPAGEVDFLRRLRRELEQSQRLYVPRFVLSGAVGAN